MGAVLTTSSTVGCGHPPGTAAVAGTAKLTAATSPVLRKADVVGVTVGSCPLVTDPQTNIVTCVAVKSVTAGEATKLTVGGAPVLLADTFAGESSGQSGPQLPGRLGATANQAKLKAL